MEMDAHEFAAIKISYNNEIVSTVVIGIQNLTVNKGESDLELLVINENAIGGKTTMHIYKKTEFQTMSPITFKEIK